MNQPFRLDRGGLIDRQQPIDFSFDGKKYRGFSGDTLASALLANGVTLVGRSFKYHRPRGIYTAGVEEMNALVDVRRDGGQPDPNTRATVVQLEPNLEVVSQNRWPSLRFDLRSIHDVFSLFIPAGFYYKTFMWPASFWPKYEHVIRKASGLGVAPRGTDTSRYEKKHAYCDLLVVGAGPAGLSAARAAVAAGQRVILVDERPKVGGTIHASTAQIQGQSGGHWALAIGEELGRSARCRILLKTTAFGYYDHNTVALSEQCETLGAQYQTNERLWYVHAKRVVLATGAIERPAIFGNNDLPGVMLASAARTYCKEFGVAVGRSVLVLTNNDSAYETAFDLHQAGVEVAGVVDQRSEVAASLASKLTAMRVQLYKGATILKAKGWHRVREAIVVDSAKQHIRIPCDVIASSAGWTPSLHLHSQSGGKARYDERLSTFVPGVPKQDCVPVGACAGMLELDECLADGGASVSHPAPGEHAGSDGRRTRSTIPPLQIGPKDGKRFVDIQDDVTVEDIELAARENFRSVEHLKRYTTLGMDTDQGKTSNVNGLTIMGMLQSKSPGAVGTTTFRPPYTPIRLGLLSGRSTGKHFAATRQTPMHAWHVANHAVMGPAALWLRPKTYVRPGETYAQAWRRECENVRRNVGIVDVSTLGKIEVQGPDAAEFLDRVYANKISSLKVGKARYGIMLREDGMVFDDGTVTRWDEQKFILSTTTTNAAAVMSHFEYMLAVEWSSLRVRATSVTDHFAQIAIAGPKSREILAKLAPTADVSNSALPHMSVCKSTWKGVNVLICRVSYSGELAYEVAVAASYGEALWKSLMKLGADHSIMPYGTEAMGALRIEKGHVAGPELDGRTTARDLGMAGLVKKEGQFVGKALMKLDALQAQDRPTLVGLRSTSGKPIPAGSHLVSTVTVGEKSQGWVSSSTYSPTLNAQVALGLLVRGKERMGQSVVAWSPLLRAQVDVTVVDPCFFDSSRERVLG